VEISLSPGGSGRRTMTAANARNRSSRGSETGPIGDGGEPTRPVRARREVQAPVRHRPSRRPTIPLTTSLTHRLRSRRGGASPGGSVARSRLDPTAAQCGAPSHAPTASGRTVRRRDRPGGERSDGGSVPRTAGGTLTKGTADASVPLPTTDPDGGRCDRRRSLGCEPSTHRRA
jgi:hypothetical protein